MTFKAGDIILYEGPVWDIDARAWETFDRGTHGDQPKPRCVVVAHVREIGVSEHVRVKLERWPDEPYEYLIFEIDRIEIPTKYIAGLFDEHEFMEQMPPHYGFVAYGPYDTAEEAQAVARTLSTDPDEGVVLELVWKEPASS